MLNMYTLYFSKFNNSQNININEIIIINTNLKFYNINILKSCNFLVRLPEHTLESPDISKIL